MKKVVCIFPLAIFFLLINISFSYASASITYYYGETIKIEDSNVEIISNEITIDTIKSKIENVVFLKNTSNKEINTSITIPLDNKELSISTKALLVKINGVKVDYTQNDKGEYVVETKIPSDSGKKVEIIYLTDNNLQNAKIIKYNFENLKNRTIGKVKVNVIINETNIPFIEKIYPGHYTFEDNTISIEYYNYKVNNLTKEVIVQKETINNLLYGRENNFTEVESEIIQNWINGKNIKYSEDDVYDKNEICKNIIYYLDIKEGKSFYPLVETNDFLYGMMEFNDDSDYDMYNANLKGKTICIDFVETEGNKELYVLKDTGYVKMSERDILKTNIEFIRRAGNKGAHIIFIGEGINEEKISATDEEKIEYINSINADMYLKIELYSGKVSYREIKDEEGNVEEIIYNENGKTGYYRDNDRDIAKAFSNSRTN